MFDDSPISTETIAQLAYRAVKAHEAHMELAMANDTSPERQTRYSTQLASLKTLYDKYRAEPENAEKTPDQLRAELNALLSHTAAENLIPRAGMGRYYPVYEVSNVELQEKLTLQQGAEKA